jgi:shikimate kinase
MESVQAIKQRFEIIGNDPKLNRSVEKAIQVAPTDISVLVTGESAVYGDEAMEHFKQIGTVIYLKVSEKELESRLGSLKERGVVSNGKSTVEEIFEDRKRLYEKYADITIVQEGRDIRMIVEDMYKKLTKLI